MGDYTKMANDKNTIRKLIDELKAALAKTLSEQKRTADALRAATKVFVGAEAKMNKNARAAKNEKIVSAYESAKAANEAARAEYTAACVALSEKLGGIKALYAELASVSKEKEVAKQKAELEKYLLGVEKTVAKNCAGIEPASIAAREIAKEQAAEAPTDATEVATEEAVIAPKTVTANASVASVNVAPVTIDVTPIVERAIAAVVQKLGTGMDKKLAEYVDNLKLPELSAGVGTQSFDGASANEALKGANLNAELGKHILEEEKFVADKLTALCEQLKVLLGAVADMSEAYMQLATKQKELTELQKQTNDMQRHTMREQQGVQVNQKLVNQEQVELVAEQSLVVDGQKAAAEKQKAITEAQRTVSETQKAVVETQTALEDAMKSVMQSQKEIIATQHTLIQGNAKNQEAQKSLIAKQEEINVAQKEALNAHKQIAKEQKAIAERQKEIKEGAPTKAAPKAAKPQAEKEPALAQ